MEWLPTIKTLTDILSVLAGSLSLLSAVKKLLDYRSAGLSVNKLIKDLANIEKEELRKLAGGIPILPAFIESLAYYLSASLIETIYESLKSSVQEKKKREDILRATISGMMVNAKTRTSARAYPVLILSLLGYIGFQLVTSTPIDLSVVGILSLFILLAYANQAILEYRIRKGMYGYNSYEAREIISFIVSHNDKSDFTDSGGFKDILPEAEMEKIYKRIGSLVPEV